MTRTALFTITPLLDVGGGDDSVPEALERIRNRERANVRNFEVAREVLRALGLDEDQVEDRVHFAITGEVLAKR